MTGLPKDKMTADEFLRWAEALPKEAGKYELIDGEVVVKHGPVTGAARAMPSRRASSTHGRWSCSRRASRSVSPS